MVARGDAVGGTVSETGAAVVGDVVGTGEVVGRLFDDNRLPPFELEDDFFPFFDSFVMDVFFPFPLPLPFPDKREGAFELVGLRVFTELELFFFPLLFETVLFVLFRSLSLIEDPLFPFPFPFIKDFVDGDGGYVSSSTLLLPLLDVLIDEDDFDFFPLR